MPGLVYTTSGTTTSQKFPKLAFSSSHLWQLRVDAGKNRSYKNERFQFEIIGNSQEFLAQKYKEKVAKRGFKCIKNNGLKIL